jgi:hypothetical protein
MNAQGGDVVAGIRTPQHRTAQGDQSSLYDQFAEIRTAWSPLHGHAGHGVPIEKGKLYMLQTRKANAPLSPR